MNKESSVVNEMQEDDTDVEGGDTNVESDDEKLEDVPVLKPSLSTSKTLILEEGDDENPSSSPPLLRASSRLLSMKRKGKVVLLRELTNEFEYNAGDVLTVRGEEDDFYVCRVLEDVPVTADSFQVAWFDRVGTNVYEPSFDDVCHMGCVITRVSLDEKDGKYSLPEKCIKRTKRLLREALAEERGEQLEEDDDDDAEEEEEKEDMEEEEDEEEEDEEAPPTKRIRSSSSTATTPRKGRKGKQVKGKPIVTNKGKAQKRKAPETPKKEKKEKPERIKPRRPGVLIPNDEIELIDVDPTFETREDVGLMPCKQSIRAVHLNDMEMLKRLIKDVKNVHSVHWSRSPDIKYTALHYALINNNKEAVEILVDDLANAWTYKRCSPPKTTLDKIDIGSYNFHTFSTFTHSKGEVGVSRGSREGNNAFLREKDEQHKYNLLKIAIFILKHENVSLDMLELYLNLRGRSRIIYYVYCAIRCGNRAVAKHLIDISMETNEYGFSFLHKEVLSDGPLSKIHGIKNCPYHNCGVLPLHAACINPNPQYLKQLLKVLPEYQAADEDGYRMIHYASACEGPGPLKVLLSRGVDPNTLVNKPGITPLMIAAKYGREANVEVLLASTTPKPAHNVNDVDDNDDDDDELGPRVVVDMKSKSGKAAIHYAASRGHANVIKALVCYGSNINLKTCNNKGSLTPLMQGAMKGNLEVVKTCVVLGGKPDFRAKWTKTPLMYAVMNGHSKVAAYLLRLGVDPNAADTSGNSPVHYAAAYGWLHCLKLLIKAGANPNAVNHWKTTPLALALQKEHTACAEYLLSLGTCDVNCRDDNGLILLSQTIKESNLTNKMKSRVSFLVTEKNADVNTVDTNGWTPLHHLAANSVYISPGQMGVNTWLFTGEKKTTDNYMQQNLHNDGDDSDGEFESDSDEYDYSMFYYIFKEQRACSLDSYNNSVYYSDTVSSQPLLISKWAQISCDIVDILVKAGADVNVTDVNGLTPLMVAILQHNYPLIRKLIDVGASPSVGKYEQERQALHLLVEKQDDCDLRQMYPDDRQPERTGTTDEQVIQRQTFLKLLIQKANVEMLEMFISHGIDLSAADNNGLTSLMIASKTSNLDMFEVLLDYNADLSVGLENTGGNLLHSLNYFDIKSRGPAAAKMFKMMEESAHTKLANTVDNNGFTPLLLACKDYVSSSHTKDNESDTEKLWCEYFKILIEGFRCNVSASVNICKKKEKTHLPKNNTFEILLTEEDKADYTETGQFTCLHFFTHCTNLPSPPLTVQLLLKHLHGNADVINSRDLLGRTPLHCAVIDDNGACVEELLKHGADINLGTQGKDEEEKQHFSTALILACKPAFKLDIARCLLKWKANPNLVDKNGQSALSQAVTNTPDNDSSHVQLVSALLEAGADVNSTDNAGRSVLHYAVNTNTGGFEALTEVEDLILKNGADTTKTDDMGRLPLHYAFVKMGCDSDASLSDPVTISSLMVDAMQEQTQDIKRWINHADNNGQTPLHRAAIRGATLCLLHLIKKGAEIHVQDKDGNTPFSLAIREGHNSCAMALIQQGSNPKVNVVTPVTRQQMEDYENEKTTKQWTWKELYDLKVPQPVVKSAFYEVVQRNWQDVAYLMLEVAGLDFILAIKAVLAAKEVDLAWTLLRKQRKDACLKSVDDTGRNMLHLLALHLNTYNDVVNKIAVHVLERGVSPSSVDSHGAIPLHYAACNGNKGLCELLLKYNPSTINTVLANQSGMTPFACCFDSNDLTPRHDLIEFMIKSKPKTLDVCYKVGEGEETTTPLIEACVFKDTFLMELLLKNDASVNFAKANGRTPLMEVVRANNKDIAEMILNGSTNPQMSSDETTKVDLASVDNDGKTVVHHCVKNREYGSSENVDMLALLAKFGAPLNVHDNNGCTPLDYAKRQPYHKMKKALLVLMTQRGENIHKRSEKDMEIDEDDQEPSTISVDLEPDIDAGQLPQRYDEPMETDDATRKVPIAFWEGPEPDVESDSESMLAEARTDAEEMNWDPNTPPPLDKHAEVENGEVYLNPDTGIPYDVWLTKIDTKYGMYGLNVFYKIQVVHQKGKDRWVLLNRWGRIGNSGAEYQRTPFMNPEDATKEFRKIFRSKTGNDWNDKENFKKIPKKYTMVRPETNPELNRKKVTPILKPFDLTKCPPSRLSKETQEIMKILSDVDMLSRAMKLYNLRVDTDYLPLGCLSITRINEARDVLKQIKKILEPFEKVKHEPQGHEDEYGKVYELSNMYFTLMPTTDYSFEETRPLNKLSDVKYQLKSLDKLTKLVFVSKLLLAAQYRSKEINPVDYCYRVLGAHVKLLDHNSEECQLILKAIYNTTKDSHPNILERQVRPSNRPVVQAIFRFSRPMERERMASCGVHDNHRLLWHATKKSDLLSVFKYGLREDPYECYRGSNVPGIEFSDILENALENDDSCRHSKYTGPAFVVLSQVALGSRYRHNGGKAEPDPTHNVTMPIGATLATGPVNTGPKDYWPSEQVFTVDEYQIQQRYLVYFVYKKPAQIVRNLPDDLSCCSDS